MSLQQFNQLSWMADDAAMRTKVQAFITAAVAAGLVRTTDTGQLDETTILRPTAAHTNRGYMMFRFDDALQATKPIFIKVEVISSGNTAAFNNGTTNVAGNWGEVAGYLFSVGTATDGAGTFVGKSSNRRWIGFAQTTVTVANVANANHVGTQKSIIAADMATDSRFLFYWGIETAQNMASDSSSWTITTGAYPSNGNPGMGLYCVERSRDADGTPNGDGISILACGYPNVNSTQSSAFQYNTPDGSFYSLYMPYTRPNPLHTRWYCNTAYLQPSTRASSLYNNNLGMICHLPLEGTRVHNPLLSFGGYWTGDYTWDGVNPSPVKMYGTDRDYRPLGGHQLHIERSTPIYQSIFPMVIWE